MGKPNALSRRADHGSGSGDNENMILLAPDRFAIRALQGLEVIGEEWDILKNIWKGVQNAEKEEAIAKTVKELQKPSTHSMRSAKWAKEETSEPPKAASESPTETQQHPELTGTFAAPTSTSSSRQQQLHPPIGQMGIDRQHPIFPGEDIRPQCL